MSFPKTKLHKAWIILIICCLSQGAAIGIGANCVGVFYDPVSIEFGCSMASISLFLTIVSMSQFVVLTFLVQKAFRKIKTKYVMLGAAFFLSLRGFLALSDSVWQWWVVAAISGIGSTVLCGYAASVILERWFAKKFPTALSILGVSSGLFGIVMSIVVGNLIKSIGWRPAIVIAYIILFVFEIPTLFLALNPYEQNEIPYGLTGEEYELKLKEQEVCVKGDNKKVKLPFSKKMAAVLVLSIITSAFTSFIIQLAPLGYAMNVKYNPSLIVTFYMIGNVFAKFFFGGFVERKGLRNPSVFVMASTFVGLFLMLLKNDYLILVGALLFGFCGLMYSSMLPLYERIFYPNSEEYTVMVQIHYAVYAVTYAAFCYLYGLVRDLTGNYYSIIYMLLISCIITIIFLFFTLRTRREN